MNRYTRRGHMTAIITVLIWGTTFISTKVLLEDFQPVEILFIRFLLGYGALWLVYPHPLRGTTARQEVIFAGAGLCGICLYYLLENIALSYSMASNVGVIVAVAPLFTALLAQVFLRGEERLSANFFAGFLVAMVGVALISFNGQRFAGGADLGLLLDFHAQDCRLRHFNTASDTAHVFLWAALYAASACSV